MEEKKMSRDDEISLEEERIQLNHDDGGLNLDDFGQGNFLKNPEEGQTIIFEVLKVSNNLNTKAKNKDTDKEFDVGLKQKDGKVRRIDIDTDLGVYTISTWECFFKLFGKEGLLVEYAKKHNKSFTGAKISIKRLVSGIHANYALSDLSKIIGKSMEETKAYQDNVKLAVKEQRLFEVKLLN
jgi:hypothetical protein